MREYDRRLAAAGSKDELLRQQSLEVSVLNRMVERGEASWRVAEDAGEQVAGFAIDETAGWNADEDGALYDASEQKTAEAGPKPAPLYKPPVRITTEDELTAHLEHTYGRPANRASRRAASKKVAREIVRLRRSNYYT